MTGFSVLEKQDRSSKGPAKCRINSNSEQTTGPNMWRRRGRTNITTIKESFLAPNYKMWRKWHRNTSQPTAFLRFWRWCATICNFFYFVHCLYFNKTTFRKLDLLPSSGKKGRTGTLATGPPGWASLRPGLRGPNSYGFWTSFFTWRWKKIQLPKRCSFIEIQTMGKVQKKNNFTYYNCILVTTVQNLMSRS
jgi:hypothetical protein